VSAPSQPAGESSGQGQQHGQAGNQDSDTMKRLRELAKIANALTEANRLSKSGKTRWGSE
jgi:hypothetical protein